MFVLGVFLCTFAKQLQQATFVVSIRPHGSKPLTPAYFHEISYWRLLLKFVNTLPFCLK